MSEIVPTSIDPSLRDRQRDLTRRLIVDALTQVILRDGISEFSMQSIADEAHCSLRTLYRYFPSREAVLVGLDHEMEEFVHFCFDRLPSAADEDLVTLAEQLPLLLDERRDLVRAWVVAVPASRVREAISGRMSELVGAALDRAAPSLTVVERSRAFAALRLLASSRTWLTLSDQLNAPDATAAWVWMMRTLLADLAHGGRPGID